MSIDSLSFNLAQNHIWLQWNFFYPFGNNIFFHDVFQADKMLAHTNFCVAKKNTDLIITRKDNNMLMEKSIYLEIFLKNISKKDKL